MKSKHSKRCQNNLSIIKQLRKDLGIEPKSKTIYQVSSNTKNVVTDPSGLNCKQRRNKRRRDEKAKRNSNMV